MTQGQLKKYKKILVSILEELTTKLKAENPDSIPDTGDEVDLANILSLNYFGSRMKARDVLYFRKVRAAIERIEKGTYGICCYCEEPIPPARLDTRPATSLCFECKEEQELKELHYVHGKSASLKLMRQ